MELFESIAQRHSYRDAFTAAPVPRADLERILQAGLRAPSGYNAQTTTFVAVDDPALLAQLAAMQPGSKAMATARAVIAVCTDAPEPASERIDFALQNMGAATENVLLAITALGYASVWIEGWLCTEGRAQAVGRLLGAPESVTVRILLPVGVPAQPVAERPKRPFAERAWFNRWGG